MLRIVVEGNLTLTLQRITRMMAEGDFTPAPERTAQYFSEQVVPEIFATGGHGRWRESIRARKTGSRTMIDTGALFDALSSAGTAAISWYSVWYREYHEAHGVMRLWPAAVEVGVRTAAAAARQHDRPYCYLLPQHVRVILENWMKWAGRSFSLRA